MKPPQAHGPRERIVRQVDRIDFSAVNQAALAVLPALCRRWLADGKLHGREWVARNPTRLDGRSGSFSINTANGRWGDFATGDVGGDPVSLAAYLFHGGDQLAAARALKNMLGV